MTISKKDIEHIAGLIAEAKENQWTIQGLEKALAGYFASENPRFDRARFIRACRPYQEWKDAEN